MKVFVIVPSQQRHVSSVSARWFCGVRRQSRQVIWLGGVSQAVQIRWIRSLSSQVRCCDERGGDGPTKR